MLKNCLLVAACTLLYACDGMDRERQRLEEEAREIDNRIAQVQTPYGCAALAAENIQAEMVAGTFKFENPLEEGENAFDLETTEEMEAVVRSVGVGAILYFGCLYELKNSGKIDKEEFERALGADYYTK